MRFKIFVVLLLIFMLSSQVVSAAPPLHFTDLPGIHDVFRSPPLPGAPTPDWIPDTLSFWETAISVVQEDDAEILAPLPFADALILPSYPMPAYTSGLADISGHWAEQAILANFNRGIVHIPSGNNVMPNQSITRGEFAFSLDRWITANYNLLQSMGFTYTGANLAVIGVPDYHPFRTSINSLALIGMVGGDVDFMADEYVQRQEASRIWLNLLLRLGHSDFNAAYLSRLNVEDILSQYQDQERIAAWARDSAAVMTDRGCMGGAGGNFRPTDALTRAEVHMIFQNIERYLRGGF